MSSCRTFFWFSCHMSALSISYPLLWQQPASYPQVFYRVLSPSKPLACYLTLSQSYVGGKYIQLRFTRVHFNRLTKLCIIVKLPYCQFINNYKIFHGTVGCMPYRRAYLIGGCIAPLYSQLHISYGWWPWWGQSSVELKGIHYIDIQLNLYLKPSQASFLPSLKPYQPSLIPNQPTWSPIRPMKPIQLYQTQNPKPILAGLEPLCSKGLFLLLTRPLQALSDQLNLLSQPQLNLLRPQSPDLPDPKPALLHPK